MDQVNRNRLEEFRPLFSEQGEPFGFPWLGLYVLQWVKRVYASLGNTTNTSFLFAGLAPFSR